MPTITDKNIANIILVEDDTDLCESLVDCLELYGYAVTGVATALAFYQMISAKSFDLAIIDIGLPDQSGLVIVSHLKNNNDMGIVVLTALGSPEARLEGYENGADLYLVKPTKCKELAAAIANLLTRLGKYKEQPSTTTHTPLWTLNRPALQLVVFAQRPVTLTVREATFLQLLMNSPGETVSRQATCHPFAFSATNCNDRRMDSMVRRLRKKVKDAVGLELPILTVYKEGYVFSGHSRIL